MLNSEKNIIKSKGVDIPIMYVYLAGRIAGNCIDKCLDWRYKIVNYYKNYKDRGVYPIAFLDALNSNESDSIDKQGLTSALPSNLIYDKDLMSVKKADVVVANMEDYMEDEIEYIIKKNIDCSDSYELEMSLNKLINVIKNRRPNYGTNSEVAWTLYLKKPLILIAGNKYRKNILENHPFTKQASVIVLSVDELLEKKWLNILYKSISGATYE